MKNPLTLAGIEAANFRSVAQHLNHCATAVPFFNVTLLYFKLSLYHSTKIFFRGQKTFKNPQFMWIAVVLFTAEGSELTKTNLHYVEETQNPYKEQASIPHNYKWFSEAVWKRWRKKSSYTCPNSKPGHISTNHSTTLINYNWINQLSNTTIWWLDMCCLLHGYQLHVSALMTIFRLID